MYDSITEVIVPEKTLKITIWENGDQISYSSVLGLWESDERFRNFFTNILKECPFDAFRWETPPIKSETIDRPFEFVLHDAAFFVNRTTDSKTFSKYFAADLDNDGIVVFKSLGKDSTLIVPTIQSAEDIYGHFASFLRNAPTNQIHALWKTIATIVKQAISDSYIWLNTAGGGVAWLHIRLDSRPKYYSHTSYKNI